MMHPDRARFLLAAIVVAGGLFSIGVTLFRHDPFHVVHILIPAGYFVSIAALLVLFRRQLTMLESMRQNMEAAQELAEIGSWERDLKSGRGYWSPERFRLFGLEPRPDAPSFDEFISLIHPDDRVMVREAISAAIEHAGCYSVEYRLADDPLRKTLCSRGVVKTDRRGKPVKIVGTTQNITARKQLEEMSARLVNQRDLFVRRLGHDINTPLTPLVALLPLIYGKATDPKQREWIEICIQSVTVIRNLVSNAMQLARRNAPDFPLSLTALDLAAFVTDLMASLREEIDRHGLSVIIRIDDTIRVIADPSELAILFTHLVRNVIAYTPCGAVMEITASRTAPHEVTVSVKDNGSGLTQEECSLIFDEFYRGDPARHDRGSTGLGLSICRQIVTNHGGRIWARSVPGEGTTISFTLKSGEGEDEESGTTGHDRRR